MELLVAHAHEKPNPLADIRADVPDDLQAIIMRCLEKDPAKRFASAEELEEALTQCGCAELWTKHCAAQWWKSSITAGPTQQARVLVG
jgi:eukaryotic-like serine/threonine-protein kinase